MVGSPSPATLSISALYSELCWVVYSSGFKYEVVKKYWPAITVAYRNFNVEAVANLATNLEPNAKEICRISSFSNLRKAKWCILNAKQVVKLHNEMGPKGLTGWFIELSHKSPDELAELAPAIIARLGFKGIGPTTVFHLMKNLGIDIFKPDIHVRRLLTELSLLPHVDATTMQVCEAMQFLSHATGMKISELDTLLFYYGQAISDSLSLRVGVQDSNRI